MSPATNKFSPEVRARAVRLVMEREGVHLAKRAPVSILALRSGAPRHTGKIPLEPYPIRCDGNGSGL